MLKELFTKHPTKVGETYWQHFCYALPRGFKLFFSGVALLVHSIFPFLFITTASNTVTELTNEMEERAAQRAESN